MQVGAWLVMGAVCASLVLPSWEPRRDRTAGTLQEIDLLTLLLLAPYLTGVVSVAAMEQVQGGVVVEILLSQVLALLHAAAPLFVTVRKVACRLNVVCQEL